MINYELCMTRWSQSSISHEFLSRLRPILNSCLNRFDPFPKGIREYDGEIHDAVFVVEVVKEIVSFRRHGNDTVVFGFLGFIELEGAESTYCETGNFFDRTEINPEICSYK